MTLLRDRRKQQALRLILPLVPWHVSSSPLSILSARSSSGSSSSSNSSSPGINSLSDLKKLQVIGQGSGGTVYKVCHEQTGAIYALKVLNFGRQDGELAQRYAISEANIFQRVDSSEYIVRCVSVLDGGSEDVRGRGPRDLCFVMEYMDLGSLDNILCKIKKLPENVISRIARNVLKGLQYLHGMKIVHGDIKPSNLLVNSVKGEVKLADFGASRVVISQNEPNGGTCMQDSCTGTCAYMSPERMDPEKWNGDQYVSSFAGDVWSLGVVVMECYMGRFPLIGAGQKPDWPTLMWAVCFEENVKPMLKMASPEFQSFCQRCLERDWRKRGTVEELLSHPFVDK